jgi:Protein of unknown function (DUF3572)
MANSDLTRESAETIAIEALGFVAADPELLPRFLAITGIEAQSIREAAREPGFLAITGIEAQAIRQAAREPGFLAGVLQFILAHEPTLMKFSEASGLAPATVAGALRRLPLGDDSHDIST